MRSIINLIRWLYHFACLLLMIGGSIGFMILGGAIILLVICCMFGWNTDFINYIFVPLLWIGGIISVILAFLTAGNEDAEQAFLNNVHENHLENERRMEEQNRQMTNWALKDYHRSKGRFWW